MWHLHMKKIMIIVVAIFAAFVSVSFGQTDKVKQDEFKLGFFGREGELPTANKAKFDEWEEIKDLSLADFNKTPIEKASGGSFSAGDLVFLKVTWAEFSAMKKSGFRPYSLSSSNGILVAHLKKTGFAGPMLIDIDGLPGFVVKQGNAYSHTYECEAVVKSIDKPSAATFWIVLDNRERVREIISAR